MKAKLVSYSVEYIESAESKHEVLHITVVVDGHQITVRHFCEPGEITTYEGLQTMLNQHVATRFEAMQRHELLKSLLGQEIEFDGEIICT